MSMADTPSTQTQSSTAETIVHLTGLIQGYITGIAQAKNELAENRGMLDDALINDPGYKEALDKAKEATKQKNAVKSQLMKQPNLMELNEKVKDLRLQVTEQEKTMSELLQQYAQLTGATTFEDASGNVKEIIYVATLVSPKM